ncbi:UNVERIFIED_CONTAM: hypothetical protein HDU68_010391 [Siphonaria sp. JEL0065]|nr:hypothetical protein HDU68_010391 [Siphonaria sp. JEL0065]
MIQGEVSDPSVTVSDLLDKAGRSLGFTAKLVVAHTLNGDNIDLDAPAMGLGREDIAALTADQVSAIPDSLRSAFPVDFTEAELERFGQMRSENAVKRRSTMLQILKDKQTQRKISSAGLNSVSEVTPPRTPSSGGRVFVLTK